jgi:hypothetical protein
MEAAPVRPLAKENRSRNPRARKLTKFGIVLARGRFETYAVNASKSKEAEIRAQRPLPLRRQNEMAAIIFCSIALAQPVRTEN